MKKVLIFAGTTEGRYLSERLSAAGVYHEVCVATEYGEQTMQETSCVKIHSGRLDEQGMRELYAQTEYCAVIDCTHPFATTVTETIRSSLEGTEIPYFRLGRNTDTLSDSKQRILYFDTAAEAAAALRDTTGNILLTTGSKELHTFCENEDVKRRLIVRVLPGRESLELCYENGLEGKQIIAMQGPFGKEMNLATIRQYNISCLVTKESGKTGGADEKLQAAADAGIPCYIIRKPASSSAIIELSMQEILRELEKLTGTSLGQKVRLNITVGGIGMGDESTMTVAMKEQLRNADYIFGAARMIEGLEAKKAVFPYYLAKDIIPILVELQVTAAEEDISAVILYSGDTGFYSGSAKLCCELQQIPDCKVTVLPGISSLSAFSARIGENWQDAYIISAHGVAEEKWCTEMLYGVRHGMKTFLITSGVGNIRKLGELLLQYGLAEQVKIAVGYQLSYPEECVQYLTAEECCNTSAEGLYVVMLLPSMADNDCSITPSRKDESFIREKVPMTKEEVREVSICKLAPSKNAVIYDIGSGTGSIAFELAALSPKIKVYAIESNPEAVELLKRNKEKFGAFNVEIIEALAPTGLEELPTPEYAFIGGTRGNLFAILDVLYQKNAQMKVVMNAISLESICEMQEALKKYPVKDAEVSTISVSKAKEVGNYHLMQANNPVTIFSFKFEQQEG